MARIRTIKPDFWTDEKIVELSAFARLLFIGLWNFADDEGRMTYSPKKIKMQVFPADSLDISALFGEIRRESLIDVYIVDDIEYLQIKNFAVHQKIDKRTSSKIPESRRATPNPPDCSPNPADYSPNPAELPQIPPTEGKGMERILNPQSINADGRAFEGSAKPQGAAQPEKFAMHPAWQPSPHVADLARQGGTVLLPVDLPDLVAHWLTEPNTVRTQSEWDKALLQTAKHRALRAASPSPPRAGRMPPADNFAGKNYGVGVQDL